MRFSQFPNRQLNLLHGKRTLGTTKSDEELGGKARLLNVELLSFSKMAPLTRLADELLLLVVVVATEADDGVVTFVSTISAP